MARYVLILGFCIENEQIVSTKRQIVYVYKLL